ncbi:MAG: GNAT family N-acetyltransferase [Pseudodesulfovibrio sp.]
MPTALHPESRTIRAAHESDLERILALQKDAYRSEAEIYGDWNLPPLRQTLEDLRDEYKRMLFLVIESKGALIGSIRAFAQGGICLVGKLIVSPRHQNRGLGTALLREVESRFPDAKAYELFTGARSAKNLHLYRKLGYSVVRRQDVSPSLTLVFLRKPNRPGPGVHTG